MDDLQDLLKKREKLQEDLEFYEFDFLHSEDDIDPYDEDQWRKIKTKLDKVNKKIVKACKREIKIYG